MKIGSIVKKDLKILVKDKVAIIVLFLLPIMFISVMSFALMPVYNGGRDSTVKMPLVDLDQTEISVKFANSIDNLKGIEIITQLDNNLLTEAEVKKWVEQGKYPMALILPQGFSDTVKQSEETAVLSIQDPARSSTNSVLVKAIEGLSQSFAADFIIANLVDEQVIGIRETFNIRLNEVMKQYETRIDALKTQLIEIAGQADVIPVLDEKPPRETEGGIDYDAIKKDLQAKSEQSLAEPIIRVKDAFQVMHRDTKPDTFQQNVPGYTVMFAFFIVMFAGRSFINERNEGTFARILATPINKWSLFFGKMIPNYLIGIIQTTVMFSIGHLVFGMSLGSSLAGLVMISLALVWASSCLGMMVASVVRTESQVMGLSTMIVLTLAALGGTMVPLFIMPDVMQIIALITPHAWAISGYQDLLVRGMTLEQVLPNVMALFSFGLLFILISMWRLRFDK